MKYFQTRTATPIILGLAFGIFFTLSCATSDTADTADQSLSSQQQFDKKLNQLNEEIRNQPGNDELKVQKAGLLFHHVQTIRRPEQRKPFYSNLNNLSNDVQQNGSEVQRIDDLLLDAWNTERNDGVRLLQEDRSENFEQHFDAIIAHFDNAITLIPDSLVTYSLKATTLYRRGHLNDAIVTLESALARADAHTPEVSEKLAYLYLESGNASESIILYSDLTDNHPDNEHYRHGLINAFIINQQHEDAAKLLREMVQKYPARYHYRESLATEIYQIFSEKVNRMVSQQDGLYDESIRNLFPMLEEVHTIFEDLQGQVSSNEESTYRKAAFYKNASLKLGELQHALSTERVTSSEVENLKMEYMTLSLPHWERLAEINPDNMDYMSSLYHVYLQLGMDEDAESIERMYNF